MDERIFIPLKANDTFTNIMSNPDILRSFLSAALRIPADEIAAVEIGNRYLGKERVRKKEGIVDVWVRLNDEQIVDVEMQLAYLSDWDRRNIFYSSRMITAQMNTGDDYQKICKVVHIAIVDYLLFPDRKKFHSSFHLREDSSGLLYSEVIELHTLELPKLERLSMEEVTGEFEKNLFCWGKLFNAVAEQEVDMVTKYDDAIREAAEKLKSMNQNDEEYEACFQNWKIQMDQRAAYKGAYELGEKSGEKRLATLLQALTAEGLGGELSKVLEDEAYRNDLYEKYKL